MTPKPEHPGEMIHKGTGTQVSVALWHKNGDHPDDYVRPVMEVEGHHPITYSPTHQRHNDWEGQVVRRYRRPDVPGSTACSLCSALMHDHGWLPDVPPGMEDRVCPGNLVFTLPDGRHTTMPASTLADYAPIDIV